MVMVKSVEWFLMLRERLIAERAEVSRSAESSTDTLERDLLRKRVGKLGTTVRQINESIVEELMRQKKERDEMLEVWS